MSQIIFVLLFTILPLLAWWISRNATFVVVSVALGFGLGGNLVQTTISFGAGWTVFGMQLLVVGLLLVIVALSVWISLGGKLDIGSRSREFLVLGIPAIAIGLVLVLLRIMAPDSPGDLTAVGYLINHPLAEDNAKWLHLTSQLAQGTEISFNGYAGGPLLLLMSVVAPLISVLSAILLGGVNEVAVATNTLIGTQFLLIALIPFVFAVFAHGQITDHKGSLRRIPTPAIWAAMLVMVIASSTVTSFGHLSLQFVLLVLVLWAGVFLLDSSFLVKLAATLVIATTASVWLPLNVLGLGVIAISLVVVLSKRSFLGVLLAVATAALSWDAIFSSAFYVLGIGTGSPSGVGDAGVDESGNALASAPTGEIAASTHLFEAPGGTEIVAPTLGVLAVVAVLTVAWILLKDKTPDSWKVGLPLLPIAAFGAYTLVITVGDAIITGGAPHYGGQKVMFAFIVMALVSTLSIALMVFEGPILLSFGIGAIFVLLTIDSILPRALSALSPVLWPSVNASSPQYWAGAEVNGTGLQPISKSPIACLTVPPQSAVPTALPFGQESYSCTRLLVGLNALEGKAGTLPFWLQEDWLSNRENWNQYYDGLKESTSNLRGRQIIMMGGERKLQGLQPWDLVLNRYIPPL